MRNTAILFKLRSFHTKRKTQAESQVKMTKSLI